MSNRPPFETFKRATCKGSYVLGSACGNCERCEWEHKQLGLLAIVNPVTQQGMHAIAPTVSHIPIAEEILAQRPEHPFQEMSKRENKTDAEKAQAAAIITLSVREYPDKTLEEIWERLVADFDAWMNAKAAASL